MSNQTMLGVGIAGVDANDKGLGLSLFGFRLGYNEDRGLEFGVNVPLGATVAGQGIGVQARADVATHDSNPYARVGVDSLGARIERVAQNGREENHVGWAAFMDAKPKQTWWWATHYSMSDARSKIRTMSSEGHLIDMTRVNAVLEDPDDLSDDLRKFWKIGENDGMLVAEASVSNVPGIFDLTRDTEYMNIFTCGTRVTNMKLVVHKRTKKVSFFIHTETFDTFRPFGFLDNLDGSSKTDLTRKMQASIRTCGKWTEDKVKEKLQLFLTKDCPHCHKSLAFSNGGLKEGSNNECCLCNKDFTFVWCPKSGCGHEMWFSKWSETRSTSCSKCGEKFWKVRCFHCKGMNVWSGGKTFKPGTEYECCYENCRKPLQVKECPHCETPNWFPKGGKDDGDKIKCVQCKETFTW